jgi:hypothetical protein
MIPYYILSVQSVIRVHLWEVILPVCTFKIQVVSNLGTFVSLKATL